MAKKKESYKMDVNEILTGGNKKKTAAAVDTIAAGPAPDTVYKKPDPMAVLHIRIPESLRTRAEVQAVKNGVTLSRYIREVIENAVDAAELRG